MMTLGWIDGAKWRVVGVSVSNFVWDVLSRKLRRGIENGTHKRGVEMNQFFTSVSSSKYRYDLILR